MIQIMRRFGWTWVGLLVFDDDEGRHIARYFQSELERSGSGCLAYVEIVSSPSVSSDISEFVRIASMMKRMNKETNARVVISFLEQEMQKLLLKQVCYSY